MVNSSTQVSCLVKAETDSIDLSEGIVRNIKPGTCVRARLVQGSVCVQDLSIYSTRPNSLFNENSNLNKLGFSLNHTDMFEFLFPISSLSMSPPLAPRMGQKIEKGE